MGDIDLGTVSVEKLALRADTSPLLPYCLVVDDNPLLAEILGAVLRNNLYAVSIAYSCREALQLARLAPPDLVITDVYMPGMDGIELAIHLRRYFPECPVLLTSGEPEEALLLANSRAPGFGWKIIPKASPQRELLQEIMWNTIMGELASPECEKPASPPVHERDNARRQALGSWKEIASFFGKGVRTVQRWERELGLPIHRPSRSQRGIVIAFPDELEAWARCQRDRTAPDVIEVA